MVYHRMRQAVLTAAAVGSTIVFVGIAS